MLAQCGRGKPDIVVTVTEPHCWPHHPHLAYCRMLQGPEQVVVLHLAIAEHRPHIIDRSVGKTDSLQ